MRVPTSSCMTILMSSTVTWIEDFVERPATEKLSENFLRISEHEWEAAKDEVVLERIVLVSSPVVVSVICFVVS